MNNNDFTTLWVVVKVHSGIPVCAEIFKDEAKAWELKNKLRKDMNPEYDEVDVFCSRVK
jgi:hypothetical protein